MTGGAQVVTMLSGFARIKVAALCIGANGVGIIGLYSQTTALISTVAGLGLSSSGVREVAAAESDGNPVKLAKVIQTLRILVLGTGLAAAILCISFSGKLSEWTFGDRTHQTAFAALALALFISEIAAGQMALLRGLGRVRELALQSIVVSLISTLIGAACYWLWGASGIVPAFVLIACTTLGGAWWYARTVKTQQIALTLKDIYTEGRGMLRMGITFVWTGVLSSLCTLGIGIIIRDQMGLQGNGYYQAAWTMSGLLVGFVLTAMGQDFYPRLTSLINNHEEANRLINQQTEVGVLLSLPCVIATASLSTWTIPLLYSSEFLPAAPAIAFFTLGCFGRVISWPLSFVIVAKGKALQVALYETLFWPLYFASAWLGLKIFGLIGVAIAFALMYGAYAMTMRVVIGHITGFRYAPRTAILIQAGTCALILASICGPWLGILLTATSAILCLRWIIGLLGPDHKISKIIRRVTPGPLHGK